MSTRPWMAFYPADYMADTLDLTTEEHGFYLLLLMIAWRRNGPIPDDMGSLKRSLSACTADMHGRRFNRLIERVLTRFFVKDADGHWRHKRLEKELKLARNFSEKQSKNAEKRWAVTKDNNDLANATAMPARASSQSQPQSQKNISPPSEPTSTIDDPGADAPNVVEFPSRDRPSSYAFEAGIIKLNQRDFDAWCKANPYICVEAELWSLADWAPRQSNWFFAVASALAKKNQAAFERIKAAEGVQHDDADSQPWWERDRKLTPEQKQSYRLGRSF